MSKPDYARVADVLAQAHALHGAERDAWLDDACGSDAELRAEVEALLAHEGEGPALLATAGIARALTPTFLSDLPADAAAGHPDTIGAYRILGVLGQGGMGTVYRAEQLQPLVRQVALKLVRRGLDTERIVARFAAERQALARMDHPNIARVIDAGASSDGRPYFVMELVEGQALTAFCDERRLSIRQRLDLFLAICAGVQHAHQRGIIHRDLKPTNVLVRDRDGVPEPKVIDFGIQKAVASDEGSVLLTGDGAALGTPEYMSPEQAGVIDAATDTRTDIYSLGALLYELLTGTQPYELRTRTPAELQRVLGGGPPARPSLVAAAAPAAIGDARAATPAQLTRQLSGDLDNIVRRAMATQPDGRYASVERFADDIRRHLSGRPVQARDASWRYLAGRFVYRHRIEVAGAAIILLLLVGFSVTSWIQARRLAAERDRSVAAEANARIEAATAQRTADFLTELFGVSDPNEARGSSVTARELLDRGAERIHSDLRNEPEVQAALMGTMGGVYRRLGLYQQSTDLLEASLTTRRRVLGDRHPDVASSLHDLARLLRDRGELERAETLQREAVGIRMAAVTDKPALIADSLGVLGTIVERRGRADEAQRLYEDALARYSDLYGADDPRLGSVVNNLASLFHDKAAYAEAEAMYRRSISMGRANFGDDHLEVAITMNNLGSLLEETGRAADAEELYVESLRIRRRVLGDSHPSVATALNNLAGVRVLSRPAAALPLYREAMAIHLLRQGADHPITIRTRTNLARALHLAGAIDEAEREYATALAHGTTRWPEGHLTLAAILLRQALLAADRGQPSRAESGLRSGLAMRRKLLPADHPQIADAEGSLGAFLTGQQRFAEAETLLVASHATLVARFGAADRRSIEAAERLATLRRSER
jgi:serine/threonine protein kinase/tetratricopeptide (TPR) repeat protein